VLSRGLALTHLFATKSMNNALPCTHIICIRDTLGRDVLHTLYTTHTFLLKNGFEIDTRVQWISLSDPVSRQEHILFLNNDTYFPAFSFYMYIRTDMEFSTHSDCQSGVRIHCAMGHVPLECSMREEIVVSSS
jgi:hypothetical protein